MRIEEKTNAQLLKEFEIACFRITNYPNNKSIGKDFARLEKEIARRLGLSLEEYIKIVNED